MTDIVEAVAMAMCEQDGAKWNAANFNETPNGEEPEEHREYWREKARAAIEAYEAAKMRDLLSGLLVQKVASDGRIEHVDREAMMNTWEGRKR